MKAFQVRFLIICLALLALAPVLGAFKVWPLSSAVITGLSILFVGLAFFASTLNSIDVRLKVNLAVLFLIGIIFSIVASVATNDYGADASWRWYVIIVFMGIVSIIAGSELKSILNKKYNETLAGCLWFGFFVYALLSTAKYYGLLELVVPWMIPDAGRLGGLWLQPNLTTLMAWLGVLSGTVFFSRARRKKTFYFSVFLFGWVVACAASRMSWLMLVGIFILIAVSSAPKYRTNESKSANGVLLPAAFIMGFMLLAVPIINDSFRNVLVDIGWLGESASFSTLDRSLDGSSARLTELKKIVSALPNLSLSQWFFGVGAGNYPIFSHSVELSMPPEELSPAIWLHSHNIFTMIFMELGIFGLCLFLGVMLVVGLEVFRSKFDLRVYYSVGALGLIFIHSNLEFPLWYPWFFFITCLFLTNLFDVISVSTQTKAFKPMLGGVVFLMIVGLLVNVGYQYKRIVNVALDDSPEFDDYQSLTLLANDSLMGPYAVLRKYRDFPPEDDFIDWQLKEARRMKNWQPRDLVLLREYTLLLMKGDAENACESAKSTAYRYPQSAPIMLEHAVKARTLKPEQLLSVAACIESGLEPRDETIPSMEARNLKQLNRL